MSKTDTIDSFEMRYLDLSDIDAGASMMASEEQRWTILAKLGIERPADTNIKPLRAWCNAMLVENGLEPLAEGENLASRGIDMMFAEKELRMWFWFLA